MFPLLDVAAWGIWPALCCTIFHHLKAETWKHSTMAAPLSIKSEDGSYFSSLFQQLCLIIKLLCCPLVAICNTSERQFRHEEITKTEKYKNAQYFKTTLTYLDVLTSYSFITLEGNKVWICVWFQSLIVAASLIKAKSALQLLTPLVYQSPSNQCLFVMCRTGWHIIY